MNENLLVSDSSPMTVSDRPTAELAGLQLAAALSRVTSTHTIYTMGVLRGVEPVNTALLLSLALWEGKPSLPGRVGDNF